MSHTQLTLLSLSNHYNKVLPLHLLSEKIYKRKRVINVAIWNLENKDKKFTNALIEKYILFIINALKSFSIDVLLLWNANITDLSHWAGYNHKKFGSLSILWNQDIIIRPKNLMENNDNIISIDELRCIILSNSDGKLDITEFMKRKRPKYLLIGQFDKELIRKLCNEIPNKDNRADIGSDIYIIGRKLERAKYIPAPLQLGELVIIKLERIIETTNGVKLVKIKRENTIKDVMKILDGEEPESIPTVKKSFSWRHFRGEFGVMTHIMGKLIINQIAPIYRRWGGIWTGYHRESYLGKSIPDTVKFSYKVLLNHNDKKKYEYVKIPHGIDYGTFPKDLLNEAFYFKKGVFDADKRIKKLMDQVNCNSLSAAGNFDLYEIRDIVKGIKLWFETRVNSAVRGGTASQLAIRTLLKRIIGLLNKGIKDQVMVTFFLLKDARLENANHTRMIAIAPTLFKVFEVIVYREVVSMANDLMDQDTTWEYQFGARFHSSTVKALVELRDKVDIRKAKAILALDISKGYESVEYGKLKLAVQYFTGLKNLRLRFLLLAWVTFVANLDIMISGEIIKKTKGIPMGLMLSPLLFVIYVHYLLRNVDKSDIIMYIDDIVILLYEKGAYPYTVIFGGSMIPKLAPIKEVDKIIDSLAKGSLLMNYSKAQLVSSSESISNNIIAKYKQIHVGDAIKYLGREIILKGELLLPVDIQVDKGIFNLIRQVPLWAPLLIRISVFNGGLEGKSRFQGLMWEVSLLAKTNLFNRAWIFFKPAFEVLNTVQLIFIIGNYFRLSFNAFTMNYWWNQSPKIISEDEKGLRLKLVKHALLIGDKYLDDILNAEFDNYFFYDLITDSWEYDYWNLWMVFTSKVWKIYKKMILYFWWKSNCKIKTEKEEKDVDIQVEDVCFSWRKLKCWLIGIEVSYGNIIEFSLVKRFAFLLDLIFCNIDDDGFLQAIYNLFIQLRNKIWEMLEEDITPGEFILNENLDYVDFNYMDLVSEFITEITIIDINYNDKINKMSESKFWYKLIKDYKMLHDIMGILSFGGDYVGVSWLDAKQRKKKKRLLRSNLKKLRTYLVKILIVFDSVYKNGKFKEGECTDREMVVSYINVMSSMYKEEIDKQVNILEVANIQLDEELSLVIDPNIEYDYLSFINKING